MTGRVTVLYFAWMAERVGAAQEDVALPDGVRTVGDLIQHLSAVSPGHASAFSNSRTVRCAVNQEFAGADQGVRPGDEVAFFPPVTGG